MKYFSAPFTPTNVRQQREKLLAQPRTAEEVDAINAEFKLIGQITQDMLNALVPHRPALPKKKIKLVRKRVRPVVVNKFVIDKTLLSFLSEVKKLLR